jgi:hypothetical protein
MKTYYDGYNIEWLENGTFTIGKKNFKTLRDAMDYVDKRRARVNNDLDSGNSDAHRSDLVL